MRNKLIGRYLCGNCGHVFDSRIVVGKHYGCPGCFNMTRKELGWTDVRHLTDKEVSALFHRATGKIKNSAPDLILQEFADQVTPLRSLAWSKKDRKWIIQSLDKQLRHHYE